jgi:Condensation domain
VSKVANGAVGYAICKRRPSDPCPLSFSQQRLWFLDQLSPADPTYNIPYAMTIQGPLDVPALQRSLNAVIGRHEILRTTFGEVDGLPVPVIADRWNVELKLVDLRYASERDCQSQTNLLLREQASRGFDLTRDLMLRGLLLRLEEERYVFLHISHHIAWEFRSTGLLYRDLTEFYRHFVTGKTLDLPALPIQFSDFALWQREFLQGDMLARLGEYWKEQLAGAPADLRLPIDFPRPAVSTRQGKRYPMVLSGNLLDAAKTLSLRSGVTPFMSLFGAFNVFLSCYTGQQDICVGSPIARRRREEIENMIGFFVNTLVLRTDVSSSATFRELLARVSHVVLGAIAHADLPFDKLVEILRPPRTAGRMPLFQVNFRAVKEPVPPLQLHGLEVSAPEWIDNETSKFDLSLELVATGGAAGFFEFSAELFKAETIAQMAIDFEVLLQALVDRPDVPWMELDPVRDIRKRIQPRSNA